MSGIMEKRKDLKKLLGELSGIQEKMKNGTALTEAEGSDAEAKAQEAERIQGELDAFDRLEKIQAKGREIPSPTLPAMGDDAAAPAAKERPNAVAGYVSLGELFASSELYATAKRLGFPAQPIAGMLQADRLNLKRRLVPLNKAERAAFEAKAIPTLGTGVIDPQRLPEIVRATELDRLTLLDLLPQVPTTSNAIEYVRITSYTRAADLVADGNAKPESTAAIALINKPVRTFAVIMPVTEQQLSDAPAVIQEIDDHLLWDVRKAVEEQIAYGGGTGSDFTGFFVDSAVLAGRSEATDTLIDKIKRAATDVAIANFQPTGVLIHPLDWESVVLEKGSDNRYVWVVVTDDNGSRIWGMRVVECNGCEETAAVAAPERNVLVGDFQRGASVHIREGIQLAIGWNDDDFSKNKRTIRAEMRAAFALKRPGAFRKILTHSASAS